jgi:hypothetical protein
MREHAPSFGVPTAKVELEAPQTYHIPSWHAMDDPQRLAVMRQIVEGYGRDPRVAKLAVDILRHAGVKPREYTKQAEALLKWTQQNIFYVNEPGERLQSPLYTLKTGMGDCDDMVILVCSFFEAVRLPWRLCISGKMPDGKMIRYIEGSAKYIPITYSHVYCMVGNKPFTPTSWSFVEPTMQVPLGWDVVAAKEGSANMPEFGSAAAARGLHVAGSVGEGTGRSFGAFGREIVLAIIVGSLTAVGTELFLDYVRSSKAYRRIVTQRHRKRTA